MATCVTPSCRSHSAKRSSSSVMVPKLRISRFWELKTQAVSEALCTSSPQQRSCTTSTSNHLPTWIRLVGDPRGAKTLPDVLSQPDRCGGATTKDAWEG